jgi:hypothetical protein
MLDVRKMMLAEKYGIQIQTNREAGEPKQLIEREQRKKTRWPMGN